VVNVLGNNRACHSTLDELPNGELGRLYDSEFAVPIGGIVEA